jgi:uroporphyrinogen-III synthase
MPRLTGRRLLLTRSAEDTADWAEALAAEGATTVDLPCIQSEAIAAPALAAQLADALAAADWLVLTSRRGVDALAALLKAALHDAQALAATRDAQPLAATRDAQPYAAAHDTQPFEARSLATAPPDTALPESVKLAAVGTATAASARAHFGRVELVGTSTGAALARELATLPAIRAGARCVLALAENAGDTLARTLGAAGASVRRFDVYRTLPAAPLEPKHRLSALACDTVVFASPSAVTGFEHQVNVDTACQFVTIGPSTSAAVRAREWTVAAEAAEPSLSGIIDAVLESMQVRAHV